MDSIQIRRIKSGDIDDIVRIYSSIVRCKLDGSFRKSIEKQVNNTSEYLRCYVADYYGTVIGFMIGHILVPGFGIEKSAWIASLGVDPVYMGRGIGKLLASRLFKFYKSKKINRIHTSVLWDSTDVLSFFKSIGFDRSKFVELQKNLD